MLTRLKRSPDALAVLALILLWLLFFWRFWTPIQADRISFNEGDFSSQFVPWAHYAAERLRAGEIPLWNPYQYAGAPFQADPQAALTYPPHWITLGVLAAQDNPPPWRAYQAIQWEVISHVLLASLFVYIFVRRLVSVEFAPHPLTPSPIPEGRGNEVPPSERSVLGEGFRVGGWIASISALLAAITYAYSGYLSGYPPLQIPLLEAGVWLPLVLLGILNATTPPNTPLPRQGEGAGGGGGWLLFSAAMLGLCLLAGHPQTAYFTIIFALLFMAYRVYLRGWNWRQWLVAALLLGVVSGLLSAVQILPAAEFTQYTYRGGLTFDDKGGGYTFEEISMTIMPQRGLVWLPLYFGLITFALVGYAIWKRVPGWKLYTALIVLAFVLSYGSKTVFYDVLYLILPGMTLFRGQERAAFVLAHAIAIMAGLGTAHLLIYSVNVEDTRRIKRVLIGVIGFTGICAALLFIVAQTDTRNDLILVRLENGIFSCLLLGGVLWALDWFLEKPSDRARMVALVGMVAFDLFSANAMLKQNYNSTPVQNRLNPPPFIETMRGALEPGDRVEGLRGYDVGYSVAYRLPDIFGTNPLFLDAIRFYDEKIPLERRWELLGVRVVNSEWTELPVPAEIIGTGTDPRGEFNVWELQNPRGFARPVYNAWVVNNVEEARGLVADPGFDLRNTVIVEKNPGELPGLAESEYKDRIKIEQIQPESIKMYVEVSHNAILTLAQPYYPGWHVRVNGEEQPVLRTYGGLSGVYLPAGQHEVTLSFAPRLLPYIGGVSLISWITLLLYGFGHLFRKKT